MYVLNIPLITKIVLSFYLLGYDVSNEIIPQKETTYLKLMRALVRVLESNKPSVSDINTLFILTRDLNKNNPKTQNQLSSFALPLDGDIITNINGVPSIKTNFGNLKFTL